ncbi:MAG: hypothetical protein ACJA08_003384 [Cyclobacteriaceae bacterium]|jgi:hypothetical protein
MLLKRKLFGILFLLILIAPAMLTYSWLQYKRHQVKRTVKWDLIGLTSVNDLELIKVAKHEVDTKLRWEHSKEFEYEGEMYDVVNTETRGDTIYYVCWWDHEETKLNRQLKLLLAMALNQDTQQKEKQIQFYIFLKSLYYQANDNWNVAYLQNKSTSNDHYLVDFQSRKTPPPTPPPLFA